MNFKIISTLLLFTLCATNCSQEANKQKETNEKSILKTALPIVGIVAGGALAVTSWPAVVAVGGLNVLGFSVIAPTMVPVGSSLLAGVGVANAILGAAAVFIQSDTVTDVKIVNGMYIIDGMQERKQNGWIAVMATTSCDNLYIHGLTENHSGKQSKLRTTLLLMTNNDKIHTMSEPNYNLERFHKGKPLVYVHGWQNSFEDSLKTIAYLAKQVGYTEGSPSVFSWDSNTKNYFEAEKIIRDAKFINDAVRYFKNLPDGSNIIAHSLGVRVVWSVLRIFSMEKQPKKLGHIILVAGDLDVSECKTNSEQIFKAFKNIYIFKNPTDYALFVSQAIHIGAGRIGQNGCNEMNNIVVDNKAPFAEHSYFQDHKETIARIKEILKKPVIIE